MTVVEIIDFVTLYGVDVVALAAVTAAVCAILKKTLLKDAERLDAFMPYIIGSALYAAYAAAAHGSLAFLCDNMCEVISRGFAVGALATMAKAAVSKKACGAAAPVKAVARRLCGGGLGKSRRGGDGSPLRGERKGRLCGGCRPNAVPLRRGRTARGGGCRFSGAYRGDFGILLRRAVTNGKPPALLARAAYFQFTEFISTSYTTSMSDRMLSFSLP